MSLYRIGKTKLVYTDGVGSGAAVVDGLDKIDIGANSTRNGKSFSDVTADSVTTFTNKTFNADATGNSLTNVEDANIKSGVAIDFRKNRVKMEMLATQSFNI